MSRFMDWWEDELFNCHWTADYVAFVIIGIVIGSLCGLLALVPGFSGSWTWFAIGAIPMVISACGSFIIGGGHKAVIYRHKRHRGEV